MKYGYIYVITNLVNEKRYVGLTTRSIERRFKEHYMADSYLGYAIRKHGQENFTVETLDHASSHGELAEKEIYWIHKLGTFGEKGYNQTIGGDGIVLNKRLEVVLNKRQKEFCDLITEENNKFLDINDKTSMVISIITNIAKIFLIADNENLKRRASELIYELKPEYKKVIFKLKLFTPEEVVDWL